MAIELKRLKKESLAAAIDKAAHYRDLNQPEEAESICRDVLDVDATQTTAWRILGLALTDRFAEGPVGLFEQAVEAFGHLTDEYDRVYHVGVAWEREAKAHLESGQAHSAVTAFETALQHFERAGALKPDSPDPVLRWNRCVRLMTTHASLRAAMRDPREHDVRLGD
jgi:tetratricopeptide (TPR) repeat protein